MDLTTVESGTVSGYTRRIRFDAISMPDFMSAYDRFAEAVMLKTPVHI